MNDRTVLHPFNYEGVRLLPGRMLDQVENARTIYAAIPNDDILQGFRRNAGQPAPGNGMRGWCKDTSGVIFGQLLSGMVRMGRGLGDDALIEKAVLLMEGWARTLPPDGDSGMRFYEFEKLVCGLVDLYQFGGVDAALPLLENATVAAAEHFDRTRARATSHVFQGGADRGTREWYTLPGEPVSRLSADRPRAVPAIRRRVALSRLLGPLRRDLGAERGHPAARLQPRQLVQQRRHGLRRNRRRALPAHLHQRI